MILRTIHLCTALFLSAFLLVYGISAVQMAHRHWIPLTSHAGNETYALTPGMTDARLVARELMDRHEMRGELTSITPSSFRIERLGTVDDVVYSAATGVAKVKTSTLGLAGILNRIHRSRGLSHTYTPLNLWTVMLGLVSIGLLTLGASGLYLWFRNRSERRIGGILLFAGLVISGTLVVWMRTG